MASLDLNKLLYVSGVGPATLSNLADAGYDSLADLAEVTQEELEAVSGIGPATAGEILVFLADVDAYVAQAEASGGGSSRSRARSVEVYGHGDKRRLNNPDVGLVTAETDADETVKTYRYDPHLDPALNWDSQPGRKEIEEAYGRVRALTTASDETLLRLLTAQAQEPVDVQAVAALTAQLQQLTQEAREAAQALESLQNPYLAWAGKAEHTSFEVPTVSLHVHERIDPRRIMEAVRQTPEEEMPTQPSLFETPAENLPLRQAIEFYKHPHGWSNRLVAGDSLLVMNSLIEKEGLAGQVQMVFFDPPYGIKYGSNFQPFVSNRSVRDGKDEDLTAEPETIRAFRDTWELGIHSYLSYLRDRLMLARELLTETGSCFVQISDENVHRIRMIADEVFGTQNFVGMICFVKTSSSTSNSMSQVYDMLIWYAKHKPNLKYRQLFLPKTVGGDGGSGYTKVLLRDGTLVPASTYRNQNGDLVLPPDASIVATGDITSQSPGSRYDVPFNGKTYRPEPGYWKTDEPRMQQLLLAKRIAATANKLAYIRKFDDFPVYPLSNIWTDTLGQNQFGGPKVYAVQTALSVLKRCLLMTTDPGDLVFDPTCGSGTTAIVAEEWGRRWITCDTSRVAITLAKQRLMTAAFDYFELAQPSEGVGSGFKYKTVPHIMLKSIANNPEIREGMSRAEIDAAIAKYAPQETLYDQPEVDNSRVRVTGPFTVEAVPAPVVKSIDEIVAGEAEQVETADDSVARSGETLRQAEWRDELLRTGIRGKGGQRIRFARLEPLPGVRWLHADGESAGGAAPQRAVVCFGPEHAPLEQKQVERAIEEALSLKPTPKMVVFAAFQFDPEAAKDIDETNWPGVTLIKAQMNADLLTEDLKKKRASNESFWLMGQPDVRLERIKSGEQAGHYRVSVHGFDYYNTKTGTIESGGADKIAMWMLDPDYDGRSLLPKQVFFPMAGKKEGWAKLARSLRAEIDEELIEAYGGTVSLPFKPGDQRRAAVKIVDDRGIESLKIVELGR